MADAIGYFKSRAPTYMALLMQDFGFDELDAAAIMGNFGHESGGLTIYHEVGLPADKGGVSWPQFTGSRRRGFEKYCAQNKYDPHTDEAAYKYVFVELKGTEKAAVAKTKAAVGLDAKVRAFEQSYERAGIKNYPSRLRWAELALSSFRASDDDVIDTQPTLSDFSISDLVEELTGRPGVFQVWIGYEEDTTAD